MPNEQQRRLMQEALDDILPEAARQDLFAHLDDDEASFAEFNQLRRVHNLLKTAPFERAPRRIAATIMARLAEGMEQDLESSTHQQTQSRAQVEMSQELLELAVSLVTVATLPLLVAASWMVVNAYADPSLLTMVVQQMIALLRLVL
ncbi:MAG: hypothetical protein H7Y11_06015, partial [Armatimonadetes bacterium]|nr:hypothetical protein [Anaerolineae bacterium]